MKKQILAIVTAGMFAGTLLLPLGAIAEEASQPTNTEATQSQEEASDEGATSSEDLTQSNEDGTSADPLKGPVYRLYNQYTGEHFYTTNAEECGKDCGLGWTYEGIGWWAPFAWGSPVYRLYNPYSGDHHYTVSSVERSNLESVGWEYEGIGWNSESSGTPLYRQYNPYASVGTHNYTASLVENDNLISVGWYAEGVAWYGTAPSRIDSWEVISDPSNSHRRIRVYRYSDGSLAKGWKTVGGRQCQFDSRTGELLKVVGTGAVYGLLGMPQRMLVAYARACLHVPDGVPAEVGTTISYWEGAGIWLVNVSFRQGSHYAGALFSADELQMCRNIYSDF